MFKYTLIALNLLTLFLTGCGDSNVPLAIEAGIDVVNAITISDDTVQIMARESSAFADTQHSVAPSENEYAKRLKLLVGNHHQEGEFDFNYKVYLAKEVNAFAMADGTIRIYSGLMDMLNDDELRFVIGHEMGHIALKHIHKKLQLAYGSSAVRKAIASINSTAGDIARSQLGELVEVLIGAQFSQLEEKEADDYGLIFMKNMGYDTTAAVSALQKISKLGNDHSFLSSHPAPDKRAERLKLQIEGKTSGIEEQKEGIINDFKNLLSITYNKLLAIFLWAKSFF
ncbi:MAG: M48 family metallopeptidase [Desulfobulbaceae bacterium]|nr:M48 family metallopeptidase [Desulfobulbaceae bacterium]